jgi:hypothetical protein
MARFDPTSYPDRVALDASARRMRAEELGKLVHAAAAWLGGRRARLAGRLGRLAPAVSTLSGPRSTR